MAVTVFLHRRMEKIEGLAVRISLPAPDGRRPNHNTRERYSEEPLQSRQRLLLPEYKVLEPDPNKLIRLG